MVATLDNNKIELITYAYERAFDENIDPKMMIRMVYCESQWKEKAKGDFRIETGEYMANGIAQFWQKTWDKYSEKYKIKGQYEDPRSQLLLMSLMLGREKEGWRHWYNCYKSL